MQDHRFRFLFSVVSFVLTKHLDGERERARERAREKERKKRRKDKERTRARERETGKAWDRSPQRAHISRSAGARAFGQSCVTTQGCGRGRGGDGGDGGDGDGGDVGFGIGKRKSEREVVNGRGRKGSGWVKNKHKKYKIQNKKEKGEVGKRT